MIGARYVFSAFGAVFPDQRYDGARPDSDLAEPTSLAIAIVPSFRTWVLLETYSESVGDEVTRSASMTVFDDSPSRLPSPCYNQPFRYEPFWHDEAAPLSAVAAEVIESLRDVTPIVPTGPMLDGTSLDIAIIDGGQVRSVHRALHDAPFPVAYEAIRPLVLRFATAQPEAADYLTALDRFLASNGTDGDAADAMEQAELAYPCSDEPE